MSISIGSDSGFLSALSQMNNTTAASKAEQKLESQLAGNLENATDEEMMDACKSFESYLVEQVIKNVKSAVAKSEDEEGEYMTYFGDMLYQKYADGITESGELGIAQQLYEAMKRNQ